MLKHGSKFAFILLIALLLGTSMLTGCAKASKVTIDIAYRGHPPVIAVLTQVDPILAEYDKKITVVKHDIDTPDGQAFIKEKNVSNSMPLAIFINGSMDYQNSSQNIQFLSFPVGQGTEMTAAGNWTIDDLQAALSAATSSK